MFKGHLGEIKKSNASTLKNKTLRNNYLKDC